MPLDWEGLLRGRLAGWSTKQGEVRGWGRWSLGEVVHGDLHFFLFDPNSGIESPNIWNMPSETMIVIFEWFWWWFVSRRVNQFLVCCCLIFVWRYPLRLPNLKTPQISMKLWVVVSNIFYFHPNLGKIPILTNIFQVGWNHQPDEVGNPQTSKRTSSQTFRRNPRFPCKTFLSHIWRWQDLVPRSAAPWCSSKPCWELLWLVGGVGGYDLPNDQWNINNWMVVLNIAGFSPFLGEMTRFFD